MNNTKATPAVVNRRELARPSLCFADMILMGGEVLKKSILSSALSSLIGGMLLVW